MEQNVHTITVEQNRRLTATCVVEVESFSDGSITLSVCGEKRLTIGGNGLKIVGFQKENGVFKMEGNINSVRYTDKKSLVKKLFK